MSDHTKLFERAAARYEPPDLPMDGLLKRRDRKRQNQRIAAGVVGIAVFVAAVWIVTSVSSLDRGETSVVPGGDVTGPAETGPTETGPAETGPAETGVENPEPPPSVLPVPIGTVTLSGAGCALEIVAEPIPRGAGRLSLVNEMNGLVSFELVRFDPEVLTFAQFEAIVVNNRYGYGPPSPRLPGAVALVQREVAPGASGTITDYFTTGDAFAVVCLNRHHFPEGPDGPPPPGHYALVGPIVVP